MVCIDPLIIFQQFSVHDNNNESFSKTITGKESLKKLKKWFQPIAFNQQMYTTT